jgi:hypothetical protein
MGDPEVRGDASVSPFSSHESNLETDSSFHDSRAEGPLTFSLERSKHELQAQSATHRQYVERMRIQHELEELRKDNDARRAREAEQDRNQQVRDRAIFWLSIVGVILGLGAGSVAGFIIEDEFTQRWGQSLITLIVGGLIGYFTGRHST